jgi:hypothetical protein
MGGSAEAEQADTIAVFDAGYAKAAKSNNACAQQRGGMQIVELMRKRKTKIGTNDRVFGIAAVHRIPGKCWGIAEIFQADVTIPARAVGASHPGNPDTCAYRKFFGGSGAGSSRYDFADNLMPGDYSGATRWQVAFDNMQIGAAYSTHTHPQKNLTWLRLRRRNLANPKRPLPNFLRGG